MSQFLPRPCRFVVQNTGNELGDGQRAVTTPGYSAPELATTRTGTPASDVYSLGITFYEIFHAAVLKPVKAIKTASSYETGRAFKEYVSSELRSRSIESPFDAFPYLELMSSMTEENPDKRPTLDQISKLLDRSYRKAISGGPSYQVKTVANNYLWNPTIHRVLGEELFYVLIKGGNPVLDFDDIRVDLERTGTTGFSLRTVSGGWDYIARVWTAADNGEKLRAAVQRNGRVAVALQVTDSAFQMPVQQLESQSENELLRSIEGKAGPGALNALKRSGLVAGPINRVGKQFRVTLLVSVDHGNRQMAGLISQVLGQKVASSDNKVSEVSIYEVHDHSNQSNIRVLMKFMHSYAKNR